MFQKLKDNLFWRSEFDKRWKFVMFTNPSRLDLSHPHGDLLDLKMYRWREKMAHMYSTEFSVFKAIQEFSDEYHRKYRDKDIESDLIKLGGMLENAAPFTDKDGNYKEQRSFLSEKWREYADKSRLHFSQRMKEKEDRAKEIQSYRFPLTEIEFAWEKLKFGKIPSEAERIWRCSYPRKTGHEIAEEADVDIETFVFWMCVFKSHLYYSEQIVAGEHMYTRQNGDINKLKDAVSKFG